MVLVASIDEVLPKGESAPIGRGDHGADRVVGGGQDCGPNPEAGPDRVGYFGQRVTFGHSMGAIDLEREVEIAELKGVVDTEAGQLCVGDEGVFCPTPPMRPLDAGKGVDHGVEVG